MAYYYVQHTGIKGFVSHADNEDEYYSSEDEENEIEESKIPELFL